MSDDGVERWEKNEGLSTSQLGVVCAGERGKMESEGTAV
jgi:hypothetical protein